MKRTALAVAAVAAAFSISTASVAQSREGMEHGKHKGWYKHGKKHEDRYDDRYDRRNDSRWNNERYGNSRYDDDRDDNERYDNSRWENDRYGNSRYDSNSRWDGRYDNRQSTYNRREQTKNEWKTIAMASGALAVVGLLQHDNRLVFPGVAGALYSLYRYQQDQKSQDALARARASYFDRDYFIRDGVRYDRRTVTQNGQPYYQFVRSR